MSEVADIAVWSLSPDVFMSDDNRLAESALDYLMTAAHRGGKLDRETLRANAATGKYAVIVVTEGEEMLGACSVEVSVYPTSRVLTIALLGGTRLEDWMDQLSKTLDDGCRKLGADYIEMMGRPGWERVLKGYGEKTAVLMTREVPPDGSANHH